jgi:hypothetical protein
MEHNSYIGSGQWGVAPAQTRRHFILICMKTVLVLALVPACVVAWGQEPKGPPLSNLDSETVQVRLTRR